MSRLWARSIGRAADSNLLVGSTLTKIGNLAPPYDVARLPPAALRRADLQHLSLTSYSPVDRRVGRVRHFTEPSNDIRSPIARVDLMPVPPAPLESVRGFSGQIPSFIQREPDYTRTVSLSDCTHNSI